MEDDSQHQPQVSTHMSAYLHVRSHSSVSMHAYIHIKRRKKNHTMSKDVILFKKQNINIQLLITKSNLTQKFSAKL